jgi:tetratricopeptide (TPR) repeat protein
MVITSLVIGAWSLLLSSPLTEAQQRVTQTAIHARTPTGHSAWILARVQLVHELERTGQISAAEAELKALTGELLPGDDPKVRVAVLEAKIIATMRAPNGWERAQPLLDEAEQASANDPLLKCLVLITRADAANTAQRYDAALAALDRATAADRITRLTISYHRGVTLHYLGQLQAARDTFSSLLEELDPIQDNELAARLRASLSLTLLRLGERKESVKNASAAIEPLRAAPRTTANTQALASALVTRASNHSLSASAVTEKIIRADFAEALQLMESIHGPQSASLLSCLTSQGFGLIQLGALDEAAVVLQRGLSIVQSTRMLPYFQLPLLEELCILRTKQDQNDAAQKLAATMRDIWREHFPNVITAGSETDRLAMLRECHWVDAALAANDELQAADAILNTYGAVFDSLLRDAALVAKLPSDQRQRYRQQKAQLAAQTLYQTDNASPSADLRRLLAITAQHLPPLSTAQLQSAVSKDEVLIVFSPYRRFDGKPTERLAAAIITSNGTRIVRLDASCDAVRSVGDSLAKALQDQDEDAALNLMEDLRGVLWEPLQVTKTQKLYLCLDASMQRVPVTLWQAAEVIFLTSPQALVRQAPPKRALPGNWILIDAGQQRVDFPQRVEFPYTLTSDFKDHALPVLPGASAEITALHAAHPQQWAVLSSDTGQPAESAFVEAVLDPPEVLHFAGHAASYDPGMASTRSVSEWWQGVEQPRALWTSALFFPAPQLADEAEHLGTDNVLFAAEIAGINLTGTQLVTLSACQSGAGISPVSEGSYSLARAFHSAGVRDVLTCTEQLPDAPVADLMKPFYERVIQGEDAAKVLWEEQGKLLSKGDLKALRAFGYFRLTRAW